MIRLGAAIWAEVCDGIAEPNEQRARAQRIADALNLLHRTEADSGKVGTLEEELKDEWINGRIALDGANLHIGLWMCNLGPMLREEGWFQRSAEPVRNAEEAFANAVCGYGCERRFVPNLMETLRRQGLFVTTAEELDPPVCRLQLPDGSVPMNVTEAANGWHAAFGEASRENALLRGKLAEAAAERDGLTSDAVTAETEWAIERDELERQRAEAAHESTLLRGELSEECTAHRRTRRLMLDFQAEFTHATNRLEAERNEWAVERAVGQRQLDTLRSVLAKCAERFREYERRPGVSAISRRRNRDMAEVCEEALGGEVPAAPSPWPFRLDEIEPGRRFRITQGGATLDLIACTEAGHDPATLRACIDMARRFEIPLGASPEAVRTHLMVEMTRCLSGKSPRPDGPPSGSGLPGSAGTDDATRAREDAYDPRADDFTDLAEAIATTVCRKPWVKPEVRRMAEAGSACEDEPGDVREDGSIIIAPPSGFGPTHCMSSGTVMVTREQARRAEAYGWRVTRDEPGEAVVHVTREPLDREELLREARQETASARLEQRLTERAGALGMAGLRGLTVQASQTGGGYVSVNLGDLAEAIIAEVGTRQRARGSWG